MSVNFAPPVAVDLLTQAIERVRPMLIGGTTKQRVRILWAAAKNARNLGASDVVLDAFIQLATEVKIIDEHGHWVGDDVRKSVRRYGAQEVSHLIVWAQRGFNPFEGTLQ